MGKVVFMNSVSLDGYMSGPNGEIDWHLVDDEVHRYFNDLLRPMTAFVSGRRNYELMEEFWPTAHQQPDIEPVMLEFADIYRAMPKVVYSTTLQSVGPDTTLKRSVVAEDIAELTKRGDIVVGGAGLAAEFMRQDLIDVYQLNLHPLVLGDGKPMFAGTTRRDLRLAKTHQFSNGVIVLRYERP